MDSTPFSEKQQQALVDLLVLGMYSDRRLALAENDRVRRLLETFALPSDYEQEQLLDASVTRVRSHADSPESVRAYVAQLAGEFASPDLRRQAADVLSELLESDGRVTDEERALLSVVREAFQV